MKKIAVISFMLLLTACQQKPQSFLIEFVENEQGVDPYKTRIISTPDFLRMDDGEGAKDFVIFNRKELKIYSVNAEMKTVMVVEKKHFELKPPMELKHSVNKIGTMKNAPKIKGKDPQHFQYLTNGKICVEVVSIEGLMEDALKGMRDFQAVLASDSATTFGTLPADLHEPCEISLSTFAPTRHLQNGFPIQEWKPGYSRALLDFKESYQANPALFKVPKDFFIYKLQDFREGKVDFEKRMTLTEPVTERQQSPVKK